MNDNIECSQNVNKLLKLPKQLSVTNPKALTTHIHRDVHTVTYTSHLPKAYKSKAHRTFSGSADSLIYSHCSHPHSYLIKWCHQGMSPRVGPHEHSSRNDALFTSGINVYLSKGINKEAKQNKTIKQTNKPKSNRKTQKTVNAGMSCGSNSLNLIVWW